jgi:hypothetical protein
MKGTMCTYIHSSTNPQVLCSKLWNGTQQNSVLDTYIMTSVNLTLVHTDLTEENED